MICLYLFYNATYFCYGCLYEFESDEEYHQKVYHHLQTFTQILFTSLAISFIVIGIILIKKLKTHFGLFYEQFRTVMLVATYLLTVPLTFRAIFDGIKIISPGFYDWIDLSYFRNALYNFIFFLFSTYLPIIGQIMSLVFGFVRHRQHKKQGGAKQVRTISAVQTQRQQEAELQEQVRQSSSSEDTGDSEARAQYQYRAMTATDQDGSVIETTTSHNFDNSRFFDPPVENYRFMAAENAFRMEQRPGRRNIFISQSWSAANRPLMN